MKKLVLLALLAVSSIQAQKNVVKVDLLGVLLENTQLSYERVVNENSAFELSLRYQKIKGSLATLSNETEVNAIGVEGKYKFYVSSATAAPKGFYVAPVLNYSSTSFKEAGKSGDVSSFGAGLVGGHQWILGAFSIDVNLGGIYKSVDVSGDIVSIELDGLLPKFGLGIGFAF
ncbi:MAG: DUF3575 domain-containing protein [Flavobacteriaceae bacterium]|nr:DUF3575 domain-containing protein [Flavobacteriaceae bacterium]